MRMRATPATWGIIGVIIAAGALRVLASTDDFWFDEIFSWRIAMDVSSPAKVFTAPAAQIDNNHPLNTLFIRALGDRRSWQSYRFFSVVCGAGAVLLAVLAMRERTPDALFAAALIGFSYPLILYSSEARGYAPMIFFMLAALLALQRAMKTPRPAWIALYSIACILGLLAHLTFLQFMLAAMAWSAMSNWKRSLVIHIVPLLATMVFYLVFVRHLRIAGGPDAWLLQTIASTFSLLVGGAESAFGFGNFAVILVIASLIFVRRIRGDWFALASLTFLAAAAFLFVQFVLLNHRETIFPRYFLVPFTFSLLVISIALGELWRRGGSSRGVAVIALVAILAGNLWQTAQFLRLGRGHYYDAVQMMAKQTPGSVITVTTEPEQQFRVRPLLAFYQRYLPAGKKLAMEQPMSADIPAPQWLIINTKVVGEPIAPNGIELIPGHRWIFVAEFPYYGLSGWAWQLYRVGE